MRIRPPRSLPAPDSPVMTVAKGTTLAPVLIAAGTSTVEAFGVGTSVVSAGATMLASAEAVAASLPIVGSVASGAVTAVGTGALAVGSALAPVVAIAGPAAAVGLAGYGIYKGIKWLLS